MKTPHQSPSVTASPVAVPCVRLDDGASALHTGRCHSLWSLHLPQAALPSLPSRGSLRPLQFSILNYPLFLCTGGRISRPPFRIIPVTHLTQCTICFPSVVTNFMLSRPLVSRSSLPCARQFMQKEKIFLFCLAKCCYNKSITRNEVSGHVSHSYLR